MLFVVLLIIGLGLLFIVPFFHHCLVLFVVWYVVVYVIVSCFVVCSLSLWMFLVG